MTYLLFSNESQFLFGLYLEYLHAVSLKRSLLSFSAMLSTLTPDHTAKNPKYPMQVSPESSETHGAMQKDTLCVLSGKKAKTADEQNLLEERLQRLEQEIRHRQASSHLRSSAGRMEELVKIKSRKQRTREWRKRINGRRRSDGEEGMKEIRKTERLWNRVSHQMDAFARVKGQELQMAPQHLISRMKSTLKQSNKKKNGRKKNKFNGQHKGLVVRCSDLMVTGRRDSCHSLPVYLRLWHSI